MKTPNAPVAYVEVEFHDTDQGATWILSHEREAGEAIAERGSDADSADPVDVAPAPNDPFTPEPDNDKA